MQIGVISYLPNDERVRTVRWKTTVKCIKSLVEVCGWIDKPLHIVTTNWRDEDFQNLSNLFTEPHRTPLFRGHTVPLKHRGAAVSRNVLLKQLYDSGEDFMMICDDDVTIYPYYDLKDFFIDIDKNPQKYIDQKLYHICAHLANSAPFKEGVVKDLDFSTNWVFKLGGDHAGRCPQIFANFRKHLGKDVYQREYLYNELHLGGEDGCFDLDLMRIGVCAYTLTSFIAGTTEITSSFWDEKKSKKEMLKDEVWEEGQATLDYIKKEFPKVVQVTKYRLDFSAYRPKCKERILIPRLKEYIFTDKDMPVKRTKKVPLGLLKK